MVYIALLRGINVGGKNKVDMKQLVAALEKNGFKQVSTYINSGNIFFKDNSSNPEDLSKKIEGVIKNKFGLMINVLVRDHESIKNIVTSIPDDWTNGQEMKCDVIFLWKKYANPSAADELVVKPGIDTMKYIDGALIWSVSRKNVTKSGMMKLFGTDIYAHMTIRNCNTARKILARMNSYA